MSIAERAAVWLARPLDHKFRSIGWRLSDAAYRLNCIMRGYDFDGFLPRESLGGINELSSVNATAFMAYPVRATVPFIREALRHTDAGCFVDVGCGKGKQCFYVARHFEFEQIVGVDFSPALIAIANKNLRISGAKNTRYAVADASEWILPDRRCVVFMFNPFEESVMRLFLQNNIPHFVRYGSLLAYANDRLRDVVNDEGYTMIYRSETLHNSLWSIAD